LLIIGKGFLRLWINTDLMKHLYQKRAKYP